MKINWLLAGFLILVYPCGLLYSLYMLYMFHLDLKERIPKSHLKIRYHQAKIIFIGSVIWGVIALIIF